MSNISKQRTDKVYFSDVVSRLKIILRKYERVKEYEMKSNNNNLW